MFEADQKRKNSFYRNWKCCYFDSVFLLLILMLISAKKGMSDMMNIVFFSLSLSLRPSKLHCA